MRFSPKLFVIAVALVTCSTASAQSAKYEGVGRPATDAEVKALDISIGPAGKEYPSGHGTAKEGAPVFAAKCAICHGPTGEEGGVLGPRIVGKIGTRGGIQAWPFPTTIFDFIQRAMPRFNEGTLKTDQVYSLTAFLLFRAGIIKEDDDMNPDTMRELHMPNRYGFVPSDLSEIGDMKKRVCRLGHCPGPDPAAAASTKAK
jgi:S-disulfanyl-L-cysteine oxidoreductase SoxD